MMKKLKPKLRSSPKEKEEKFFLENGGIFLKKLIADCNGKSIPIRNFSSSQILKTTNNFDDSYCFRPPVYCEWYKGIIDDKPYLIRKSLHYLDDDKDDYNDIALPARMSNQNNFLKLIGCCFELDHPVLLFEDEEFAVLNYNGRIIFKGDEREILPWNVRLKIAKEVAIAITYLHTAFSRIIIHKHITIENIFVDKNLKAKLTDFTYSQSLPEGKTRITDAKLVGVFSYMDPLFLHTRSLSEFTDVYSFGICLLVFLTGKSAIRTNHVDFFYEVKTSYENKKRIPIDPMIAEDLTSNQRLQVEAFLILALRCCEQEREEDRSKMIEVAKELKRIEKMGQSLNASSSIGFPKHEMLEDGDKSVQVDSEIQIQD